MQYLQNAKNNRDPQQPYAVQAAEFTEALREMLAKVAPHPPKELFQLITRLDGAKPKDKAHLISNPGIFHRMNSILHRKPGLTMGELSQALSVPLYTATRMVDSLVAAGLAERLSDPDDRRIVRVTLTDDGLRFHEAINADVTRNIQRIMACLTTEEQDILIALFRKITASLKESKI